MLSAIPALAFDDLAAKTSGDIVDSASYSSGAQGLSFGTIFPRRKLYQWVGPLQKVLSETAKEASAPNRGFRRLGDKPLGPP